MRTFPARVHALGPARGRYGYRPALLPWLRERWLAWRHEGANVHAFSSYHSERVEVGRVPDGASAKASPKESAKETEKTAPAKPSSVSGASGGKGETPRATTTTGCATSRSA